jgi:hypothetical protein
MVFAVAALFLNLAPAIPAGDLDVGTRYEGSTAGSSSAAATPAERTTQTSDSGNAGHFNLDKVALSNTPSESEAPKSSENAAPKLTAVSMEVAHKSEALSTIRIPEPGPSKPAEVAAAEKRPYTKQWLVLSIVQHGAAAFDAYSTREAVSRGAVEDDPMMRPFAHSGAIYAAIQAGPVVLDFVARRMQHSENGFIRKMWWMPQSVSTAGFLFSGVHNLGVVRQEK